MRGGDANFRDTQDVGYTEIIDPGASGEVGFFRIGTQTCPRAEKDR